MLLNKKKMYLTRLVMFLSFLPSVYSTNTSHIVAGYEPDFNVSDIPRHLKSGRKHCFNSPYLSCHNNRRCCTHVHQKKIWCCDRQHKCGKAVKTCVVNSF